MRHLETEDGADTFIPFLILVLLRANPEHLLSNVQYIQRFRNPEQLAGENGYYLSSLNGAISFVETMDSSSLSAITQEEFELAVEKAIASLPSEKEDLHDHLNPQHVYGNQLSPISPQPIRPDGPHMLQTPGSADPRLLRSSSPAEATKDFLVRSSDNFQKTVSKPLQALGRIFTEMGSDADVIGGLPRDSQNQQAQSGPSRQSSQSSVTQPISPHRRRGYAPAYHQDVPQVPRRQQVIPARERSEGQRAIYQAADYLDDSVSAEAVQEEADRTHRVAFSAKIDTLASIFPNIEKETLEIVLLSNGEDVERTIEGLLEMV